MSADRDFMIAWLQDLPQGSVVAIAEDGSCLVGVREDGETISYYELGGLTQYHCTECKWKGLTQAFTKTGDDCCPECGEAVTGGGIEV